MVMIQKLESLLDRGLWDDTAKFLNNISYDKFKTPRGYKEHPTVVTVKAARDEGKSAVDSVKSCYLWTEEQAKAEISSLRSLVAVLFDVVGEYLSELNNLKKRKNILSFSDVESLAVKLLAVPDGNGYSKTVQAYEISKRFDYIMVDEFQDVNDVQDLIFKCVSRNESNIFAVGDVKQSIYGFRQAKPEIFINRKKEYNAYDESNPVYPAAIILDKNFRSRREVCESVNFIFKRLMTRDTSKMDYTDDDKLNTGADYPESSACNFELKLIEKKAFEDCDAVELEARYIAAEIQRMIHSGFSVKDGNSVRRATYGDFAIILRSTNPRAKTYVSVLNSCGVPAFSTNKENSFETREIALMLNFLRVIDNPTLDIPLLSVMCSPVYGFTPDDLSLIRANKRFTSLYTAVVDFSKTDKKTQSFVAELNSLRAYAHTSNVDSLIGRIYDITSFASITSAVTGGKNPVRNLNLLRENARKFEANGYKTLSEFISHIDRMIENGVELPSASETEGESLNCVRVLSIHASKGLEFPVCFIADTAHGFNTDDLKSDILIDNHIGLGIKRKDGVCRYNTLPRLAVQLEMSANMVAEELRVLYVALTRAKEKLIVVSTPSRVKTEEYLSRLASEITYDGGIDSYAVINAKCISDWICLCALIHPSLNLLNSSCAFNSDNAPCREENIWKYELINTEEQLFGAAESEPSPELIQPLNSFSEINENINYVQLLKNRLNFRYKNADIMNLPQKVTASHIAHEQNSGYFERVLSKPAFLSPEISSSVERGTAHHKFLQFCSFSLARKDLNAEIFRLTNHGVLTEAQAKSIDTAKITELLSSDLITRIFNSPNVMREERFTAIIKPSLESV